MSNEVVELGALEKVTTFQRMDENQATPHVSERVVINVSGLRFETQLTTIERFSTTLLGCKEKRNHYFDSLKNEYFFDRNRPSFDAILYYYQSGGRLRRPVNVPTDVFTEEIKFYELDEQAIQQYLEDDGYYRKEQPHQMPSNNLQRKIWLCFEYPESSTYALILAIISQLIVLLSLVVLCLDTLPEFQVSHRVSENISFETIQYSLVSFFIIECCCIAWFSVEFLIRFLTSPHKMNFFVNFMNIIDILVILAFIVNNAFSSLMTIQIMLIVIWRVVKFGRIFRIFKLSTHSKGLQILGRTIKASIPELCMLMVFFTMSVVLFSSSIYYAEIDTDSSHFRSIPDAFWWAVITMTTVGYGDQIPVTTCGKFVGSLCAITGILTIVFPIPLIISKFNYFYHREMESGTRKNLFQGNIMS